jgi:hypothetical protein
MDERTAERLLREGKISNYCVVDGKVEVKSAMDGEIESSWPAVDERSK